MSDLSISMFLGFTAWDFAALGFFIALWFGVGLLVENPVKRFPSTFILMNGYRDLWMEEMAKRNNRIFDSQVVNGMRQATAFFASAALLAIGGGVATVAQAERVAEVTSDLAPALMTDRVTLEAKFLVITLVLTAAFLKFVWANRLFGYGATVMAAVPGTDRPEEASRVARRAAKLLNTAARSFTRGLRSIYFALAVLAWLFGPWALMIATVLTVALVVRREFASESRRALLEE